MQQIGCKYDASNKDLAQLRSKSPKAAAEAEQEQRSIEDILRPFEEMVNENTRLRMKTHELRIKNMSLRNGQAKLRSKIASLQEENNSLSQRIEEQDKKYETDYALILD